MIRFALGLLTILCKAGTPGTILRENVSSLFARLYNRLVVSSQDDTYREKLLGPMITALTAAEKYFKPTSPFSFLINDDNFWGLCFGVRDSRFYSSRW